MARDRLRERIAAQFSGAGERADVWRVFDAVLETDAFLDLGYSPWYLPHVVGSPQRRLAEVVGERLAARLHATAGVGLLDVGCGRGGPARCLADRFGFDVLGVDLVRYNVARARETAVASADGPRTDDAAFVVGEATQLPIRPGSVAACTAIDALVYCPDREAAFAEVAAALEPGGTLVLTDLLAAPETDDAADRALDRFADDWDVSRPGTVADYERGLDAAGLDVVAVEDLTPHSVGRFRTWTTAFLWLHASPAGAAIDRVFESRDIDAATVVDQVRRAHSALPHLRHGLFVAEKR